MKLEAARHNKPSLTLGDAHVHDALDSYYSQNHTPRAPNPIALLEMNGSTGTPASADMTNAGVMTISAFMEGGGRRKREKRINTLSGKYTKKDSHSQSVSIFSNGSCSATLIAHAGSIGFTSPSPSPLGSEIAEDGKRRKYKFLSDLPDYWQDIAKSARLAFREMIIGICGFPL